MPISYKVIVPPVAEPITLPDAKDYLNVDFSSKDALITRLISDLDTYLFYKFEFKPTKDQAMRIKEKLYSLKNAGVELEHFQNIVQQLLNRAQVHLTNEPFYTEIDEMLKWETEDRRVKFPVTH